MKFARLPVGQGIGILFVICYLSFGFVCSAATWSDPGYTWKTIETAHFSIHYHDGLEKIAEEFAPDAEAVHRIISPLLKHAPDMKTNVVLVDNYDVGNGWATVIPNPLVTLYITDINSNLSPYSFKSWLRYVFTHEYTHILNMDTVDGGAQLYKLIFGRALFPNTLAPTFLLEGLAVYMESHEYSGGRIFNPRFEAILRMDILEDNLKSIDQAAIDTVKWPGGQLRYVYGAYFIEYLAKTYGQEKLTVLNHVYGDYVLNVGIDPCFTAVFGKSLSMLWDEWILSLKKKYASQKVNLEKEGITDYKQITKRGFWNLQPVWSDDSKSIYYSARNFDEYSKLRKTNSETLKNEEIMESAAFDDNLSINDQNLVFAKGQVYNNFYYYKDFYLLNLKNHEIKRLTSGKRAADPSFSPDGEKIVFVNIDKGSRHLKILNLDNMQTDSIGDQKNGISYFSPVFSPDGKKVVCAKWVEGDQSIYLIDLSSGQETKIVSYGLCGNPSFSPDGRYVLFDSDYSGIANLYACRLSDKLIFKITNVLGMALMPEVSPDQKKIAYVNYSSNGYDLVIIPFNSKNWELVEFPEIIKFTEKNAETKSEPFRKTSYNPIPSLLPKFWMPSSVGDENGSHTSIFTMGMDSLQQHAYQGQISYDEGPNRFIYQIAYINNQLYPQISLQAIDCAVPYSWDSGNKTYWERYLNQSAYLSFVDQVVFKDYDAQVFSVGFENLNLTNLTSLSAITAQPSIGNIRGVGVGYQYYSSRTYPASISPEDGFDLALSAKLHSKDLGSDFTFNNYTVSSSQYFKTPIPHHILALNETGFFSRGDKMVQSGYNWGYFGVRGYPSDLFSGSCSEKVSLEYRFPIAYMEKGLSYGYTFFDRLSGVLFFEAGGAGNFYKNIYLSRSFGGELNLGTISGFGYAPMNFILGYARGLDAGGENKIYFGFSGPGINMMVGDKRINANTAPVFKNNGGY